MLDHDDIHSLFAGAPETTEFRKLRKRLVRLTREALETYAMVEPGARWLVCLSGGKDSYTLLAVLLHLLVQEGLRARLCQLQCRGMREPRSSQDSSPAFVHVAAAGDRLRPHVSGDLEP